jgi:hypothetical protein
MRGLTGRNVRYKDEGPLEPQRISNAFASNLLKTCQQLQPESAALFYGQNIFKFPMGNIDFAPSYRSLVRHIVFTTEAGRGIYSSDLEVMSYWWRQVFCANVAASSSKLLLLYPGLETLTLPIRSDNIRDTWRPAFMAVDYRTREQRISVGARWLKANCPMEDERLSRILHLEIHTISTSHISRAEFEVSRFAFEEDDEDASWNHTEFAAAFERMKYV